MTSAPAESTFQSVSSKGEHGSASGLQDNLGKAPTQPYAYVPLASDRAIRVIVLRPAIDFDAPLSCVLEQVDIEDSAEPGREYEAISYCWREPIFSHTLICDESILKINPNVDSILRHLRRGDIRQRFWIDGICINQQDLAEKTVQIGLMRDIYFCAMRVHAWLGDATPSCGEAFTWIRKLAFLNQSTRRPRTREIEKLLNHSGGYALDSIAAVLTRPWFSRRWILQEIGLSHETLVHCGDISLSISFLTSGLQLLKKRLDDPSFAEPAILQSAVSQAIMVCECKPLGKSVLELLVSYRSSNCLDARDAIFALLALGRDELVRPRIMQRRLKIPRFEPSYNTTTGQIYTDFTLSSLASGYYAQMLCMAICFPCEGLCSWVPDVRLAGESRAFPSTLRRLHSNTLVSSRSTLTISREWMRSGSLFSRLESCVIPTADRKGFWLAPDSMHTVRKIHWVSSPLLPAKCSRDVTIDTFRQWLSAFVAEKVCEHSEYYCLPTERIQYEEHILECPGAMNTESLIRRAAISAESRLETSPNGYRSLTYNAWVRERVNRRRPWREAEISPSVRWRPLTESERMPPTPDTQVYIDATALGLLEAGLISLETLSTFLRTIEMTHDPDHLEEWHISWVDAWFRIGASKRRGFLQLLTSDCTTAFAITFRNWKPLFAVDYWNVGHYGGQEDGLNRVELDYSDAFCHDSLRFVRERRFCVLSRSEAQEGNGSRDNGARRTEELLYVWRTQMVLGPPQTQVGDTFLSLDVREVGPRQPGYYNSASSVASSPANSSLWHSQSGYSEDGSITAETGEGEEARDYRVSSNYRATRSGPRTSKGSEPRELEIVNAARSARRLLSNTSSQQSRERSHERSAREGYPSDLSSDAPEPIRVQPQRYKYLSMILTPSGLQSHLPDHLRDRPDDVNELESMKGYRILGDSFLPYAYDGFRGSEAQLLINA